MKNVRSHVLTRSSRFRTMFQDNPWCHAWHRIFTCCFAPCMRPWDQEHCSRQLRQPAAYSCAHVCQWHNASFTNTSFTHAPLQDCDMVMALGHGCRISTSAPQHRQPAELQLVSLQQLGFSLRVYICNARVADKHVLPLSWLPHARSINPIHRIHQMDPCTHIHPACCNILV